MTLTQIKGELAQAEQRDLSRKSLGNPTREQLRDYWRRHGHISLALES